MSTAPDQPSPRPVVPPVSSPDERHAKWMGGLCSNTGAPLSVFRRLLDTDPLYGSGKFLEWRVLAPDFLAAVLAHPNKAVRMALTENTAMPPNDLVGLVDDPEPDVRARFLRLATGAGTDVSRGVLPSDVLARAADDPDSRVRRCAVSADNTPLDVRMRLTADPVPWVRRAAITEDVWPMLSEEGRAALLDDPDARVRQWAETCELTRTTGVSGFDRHMAERYRSWGWTPQPEPTATERARHTSWEVRADYALSEGLSDEERMAVPDTVHAVPLPVPQWIIDSYDDADAMRRIASSAFVLMRRAAATAPHLPPDVVAALAADEDFYVRLTLAQRCHEVPADLMLDMFLNRSGLTREFLRYAPGFPWYDSEKLVTHAHDRVRYIALEGPHITADQVARLAEDPAPEIRAAAVRHELFPGEMAAALIDVLPGDAAQNPNLPHDLMHRMLDAAGAPPAMATRT